MSAQKETPELRIRQLVFVETDSEMVSVDHLFADGLVGGCEIHAPRPDPGMVGLTIHLNQDGELEWQAGAVLTPEQALYLANRLQRAAGLVLESGEDLPDVEREASRYERKRS